MKQYTETQIEVVFTHNEQQYVVEYDLTIDGEDCYTDITRIEIYKASNITPGAVAHGMAVVDADASMRYAEYVADKYADDIDYMTDRYSDDRD
jgi:hypothetical protein